MTSVERQMMNLVEDISKANAAYYLSANPVMTDTEYDLKKRELRTLAEQYPDLAASLQVEDVLNAVGTRIDTNTYEAMEHNPPMLSLDNAYNEEDMDAWSKKVFGAGSKMVIVTPKFDGLAWEFVYDDGLLVAAGTRGDGHVGETLMATAMYMDSIPKTIPFKERICVRGEMLLSWSNFEKAKELDKQDYANPRNAAAGIARRKTPTPSTALLSFVAYGLHMPSMPTSYSESLKFLATLGFEITSFKEATNNAEIMDAIRDVEKERPTAMYMYDGAVIRVDETSVFEGMGYTSHHPKAATAFKFAADRVETILKDVEWTKGKKGKLSPNARLETVQLAGTRVSNALLHTMKKIAELDVKIGDTVVVEKAAEIIPQIVDVRKDLRTGDERDIVAPSHCPLCGTQTQMRGEYVYCENKDCGDVAKNKLLTYVTSIGLKGIGPSAATKLAENGSFVQVPDLYSLSEQDFVDAGVAAKNATKLVTAIRDSVGTNKPKEVLAGLSIDMCGRGTAEDILEEAGHTIRELCNQPVEWFERIQNIGNKTAVALSEWFTDSGNVAIVNRLYELGVIVDENSKAKKKVPLEHKMLIGKMSELPFEDMRICITGVLSNPRDYYSNLIEENGGTFVRQFSKSIDVLLVGENAGSKLKKAQAAGIRVWTEEEFMKQLQ